MTKEKPAGHFVSIPRLVRSLYHAVQEPEVQGVLMLAATLILIATIFYWLVEGWSFLDAAYFSVVTIATVGYGDLASQTALGKLFTIGYLFAGIALFAAAVTALAQATLRSARPPKGGSRLSRREPSGLTEVSRTAGRDHSRRRGVRNRGVRRRRRPPGRTAAGRGSSRDRRCAAPAPPSTAGSSVRG